jgi:4-alpha-glucanotransferase
LEGTVADIPQYTLIADPRPFDALCNSDEVTWELIRLAWSSVAGLAMVPLQDLLNLGAEARMNLPGSAEGNWRWRCTEEMLSMPVWDRLRVLTTASNRNSSVN